MLQTVKADPKASTQMLLLAHLYAKIDSASLARLRKELYRPKYTTTDIAIGAGATATALTGHPPPPPPFKFTQNHTNSKKMTREMRSATTVITALCAVVWHNLL